jgi:hypothetical protein
MNDVRKGDKKDVSTKRYGRTETIQLLMALRVICNFVRG